MSSTATDLNWQRTSPVAVVSFLFAAVRQLLTNGLPAVAIVGAAYASGGSGRKALMLSGFLLFLAFSIVMSFLNWLRFRFCVTGDRVLVRSGVFQREELSVEFGRIQNISIREPFYMRPFGLALLSIDTAGSGQKEIILGGIKKDVAIGLRETILSKAKHQTKHRAEHQSEDTGDGAALQSDQSLLLSRSRKDIVIYGLTVNFLLWFAIAVGAFFGAHETTSEIFAWLTRTFQIEDVILAVQNGGGLLYKTLLLIAAVFVILLLLPLISVLGALFRHYGYRLTVEDETYRKNSGLLTRHDESMKRHKIQAIVLRQNFIARFFKRTNMQLRVASAGAGVENGQMPAQSQKTFVVPALHAFEVDELGAEFFPGCEVNKAEFSRVDRYRFSRIILSVMIVPVVAVTSVLSIFLSWEFVLVAPLVYLIAWMVITRYWQKLGYAVVGEYGFARRGFLGTEVTVFPLFKVQRVDVRQSRGQRRRGVAHLSIHLASHSLTLPQVSLKDVEKFRDLALYYVESSNRAWY